MAQTIVLVIERDRQVSAALARQLRKLGYAVGGIAASTRDAVGLARRVQPSLVVANTSLQRHLDGVEAAERIRELIDVPVVYLTSHGDRRTVHRVSSIPAHGFVLRPCPEAMLAAALQLALRRHQHDAAARSAVAAFRSALHVIGEAVTGVRAVVESRPLEDPASHPRANGTMEPAPNRPLSARERQVLAMFLGGLTTATLSARLGISAHTVRNHLKSISRKYGVSSQAELRELFASFR